MLKTDGEDKKPDKDQWKGVPGRGNSMDDILQLEENGTWKISKARI